MTAALIALVVGVVGFGLGFALGAVGGVLAARVDVRVTGDDRELAAAIRRIVRKGGGDVRKTFGS